MTIKPTPPPPPLTLWRNGWLITQHLANANSESIDAAGVIICVQGSAFIGHTPVGGRSVGWAPTGWSTWPAELIGSLWSAPSSPPPPRLPQEWKRCKCAYFSEILDRKTCGEWSCNLALCYGALFIIGNNPVCSRIYKKCSMDHRCSKHPLSNTRSCYKYLTWYLIQSCRITISRVFLKT